MVKTARKENTNHRSSNIYRSTNSSWNNKRGRSTEKAVDIKLAHRWWAYARPSNYKNTFDYILDDAFGSWIFCLNSSKPSCV